MAGDGGDFVIEIIKKNLTPNRIQNFKLVLIEYYGKS